MAAQGVEVFLDRLRSPLKGRSFTPVPVRERFFDDGRVQPTPTRMSPKANGKLHRLGFPTVLA
ncbi:hypothetical protein OG331_04735 [Streptomyces sp. NBC_01017]|uniref:hypothetical protein n=1 Tax=Streptomyces sp. NBC_01017 TaxID=2903721 RepID=UPI003870B425|nr:hypothetical protein OG331_04735 [Streptomyces sp. NBC_01017]